MKLDRPTPDDIPALKCLWQEAFGDSEAFVDTFFSTGFAPERSCCLREGSDIATAVYWFDCTWQGKPVAYLYALATAEKFRGQGRATALLSHVHSLLTDRNYAGCLLVPGEPGLFPFYEKMGYFSLNCAETVTVSAEDPIPVRKIDAGEFVRLRRAFLDPNDAVLGIESTRFLAAGWTFYAGNRWVLAGLDNGPTFSGMELLGDPAAAPGILAALGKATGTFRIPGKAPFALYKPLCSTDGPGYFGLPLD